MKLLSTISILGALTSCASNISDQKQIMRTIEARIQLPEGARPIEAYSRNYARLPDNKILAVFIEPFEPSPIDETEDYGCEVMGNIDENGELESRPCTEDELEETKGMENAISKSHGNANGSRWFKNSHDLPIMDGGGCSQIEAIFDLRSDSFDRIRCNGPL
mgnify:CR=1 FL=1